MLQGIWGASCNRLKVWPMFFETHIKSGEELRDGFVTLRTTFIVAESLLASVAMQPFVSNVGNLMGWQLELYGLLWMLALITDYMDLGVTTPFLCNIGEWIGVDPAVLVLVGTFSSLLAVAYSSWVIYGDKVGIVCAVVSVFVVSFAIFTSTALEKASAALETLD